MTANQVGHGNLDTFYKGKAQNKAKLKEKVERKAVQAMHVAASNGITIIADLRIKKTGNWALDALREDIRKNGTVIS
jgi:hypothetical protein